MKKLLKVLVFSVFLLGVFGCEEQTTTDLNSQIDNTKIESKVNGDNYVGTWESKKDDSLVRLVIKKGDNNYTYTMSYYTDINQDAIEEVNGVYNFDYTSFTTRDDAANADYTISHIVYNDKISLDVALKKVNKEDKKDNVIPNGTYELEKAN